MKTIKMRKMAYLESYSQFGQGFDWKKMIHSVEGVVQQGGSDSDPDLARDIVDDVIAATDGDDFFVYCRSKGVFLTGSHGTSDGGVVTARGAAGQGARQVQAEALEWNMYLKRVQKIAEKLEKLNDGLKMVIETPAAGGPQLAYSGDKYRLGKDKDAPPMHPITNTDILKGETRARFRETVGAPFLGKEYDMQLAYKVMYARGKSLEVVSMHKVRIEDMEYSLSGGEVFVRIRCESPFGQPCIMDVDRHSPTEFEDLETAPAMQGGLLMLPVGRAEGGAEYPTALSYSATPASWDSQEMLGKLVDYLKDVKGRIGGASGEQGGGVQV